jgi:pimeloyl-ACP methyl ester carboxylesterase
MNNLFLRRTGRGRPVVFLGGCPTPWDVLAPVAAAVSTTHEAIEVALPGYGVSTPLGELYSLDAAHEAVERTLIESGVRECALVGFSGGAYRALAIACRGKIRVTQVLCLSGLAGLTPAESEGFRGFAGALRAGVDLSSLATARFLAPAFAVAHPEAVVAVKGWLASATREMIAAELDAFATAPDLAEAVSALTMPIVARVGSVDAATPPTKSEAIVRACRSARIEVVDGAGHALMIEDLDGTIAALRGLLAR